MLWKRHKIEKKKKKKLFGTFDGVSWQGTSGSPG
jgi:hypothetical protein